MNKEEKVELLAENLRIAKKAMEKVAGYALADDAVISNRNIAFLAAALTAHEMRSSIESPSNPNPQGDTH